MIAQAAKETDLGNFKICSGGKCFIWSVDLVWRRVKPKDSDKSEGHKVMKFNVLQASVRAYQRNLNTHSSYKKNLKNRAELRDVGKPLDSLILVKFLNEYAETGEKY